MDGAGQQSVGGAKKARTGDGKGEGAEEEEQGSEARFRLRYVVREYALEQLEASDGGHEAEALRRAHAVYLLELGEERAFAGWGPEAAAWMGRLEQEHDNFRAALGWAQARGEAELGLRLANALAGFWYFRGYFTEGRAWLEGLLALPPRAVGAGGDAASAPGVSAQARALALSAASNLARVQGDGERALAAAEEALALARDQQAGWAAWVAGTALHLLGQSAWDQGDLEQAMAHLEESIARLRAVGQESMAASFITLVGLIALDRGRPGAGEGLLRGEPGLRPTYGRRPPGGLCARLSSARGPPTRRPGRCRGAGARGAAGLAATRHAVPHRRRLGRPGPNRRGSRGGGAGTASGTPVGGCGGTARADGRVTKPP
jgi:tetratricopeptide (TPR) repeat protein